MWVLTVEFLVRLKGKILENICFIEKEEAKNGGLVFVYGNNEPLVYITVDRVREQHLETDFALPCG